MSKQFFGVHFFIDSWFLGSGSAELHIVADLVLGSQTLMQWSKFNLFSHLMQLVVCKALKTKSEFTKTSAKGAWISQEVSQFSESSRCPQTSRIL